MKKTIFVFIVLCVSLFSYSQSDTVVVLDDAMYCRRPQFFILLNGKLPLLTVTSISFDSEIYADTIEYTFNANFLYYHSCRNKCSLTNEDVEELCNIIPDTAKVYLEYCYCEPIVGYNEYDNHVYRDTLLWKVFKGIGVVIITDFNKKKGYYHIHYELQAPWVWDPFFKYRREFGKSKKFRYAIFQGIYPIRYEYDEKYENRRLTRWNIRRREKKRIPHYQ